MTISNHEIHSLASDIYQYTAATLKKSHPTVYERSLLGEAYLCMEALRKIPELPAYELVTMERTCKKIHEMLYRGDSIFYFSSLYYLKNIITKPEPEVQRDFRKVNLDVMAMRLHIMERAGCGADLGFSEDDCFFERAKMSSNALARILYMHQQPLYAPALYCLCNLLQTLLLYCRTIHGKYQEQALACADHLIGTLGKYARDPDGRIPMNNPQLAYFIREQQRYYQQLRPSCPALPLRPQLSSQQKPRAVLRALTNLTGADDLPFFQTVFESVYDLYIQQMEGFDILEKILFLHNIAVYLTCVEPPIAPVSLGISEKMPYFRLDDFLNQVFQLDQIDLSAVTPAVLERVQGMKDGELRSRFAGTVQGVRPDELQREAAKPHGSFEIADMELRVSYHNRTVFLCMPFKSGAEIKGASVPVSVAYQIVRPFTEFDACVVVFVTAKRCSEQLMNQIKKLQSRFNWPIAVIEEKCLAALLLYHGQL